MNIGFIGLGVMGGPMCRNMALKSPGAVTAFDLNAAACSALEPAVVAFAASIAEIAAHCDIVFLSLPGGPQVEQVCLGPDGLATQARGPAIIVDLSTTTVASARAIHARLAERGIAFADAPVARTREAAQRGELSIMVGADAATYGRILPLLQHIGSDVALCGSVGCGQAVKLINNALVFEHTAALAEMMVVGERAGVEPGLLLDVLSKGSGDSFVLRNHGRKAMLPRVFPDKAFPPEYVIKDISYLLELSQMLQVPTPMTELAHDYYQATSSAGYAGRYFPVVIKLIEEGVDVRGAARDKRSSKA
jgi:3-hydroxyisobutyrate dehydrogenase-like beta-hydroxyacid dehydrogenase